MEPRPGPGQSGGAGRAHLRRPWPRRRQAPKAAIDLAAAPFLQGEFVVKRITLVGVQFTLVHMKYGRIRLGNAEGCRR